MHALLVATALVLHSPARADVSADSTRLLFLEDCAPCHGPEGEGDGEFIYRLRTKPPDFTTGRYKFRSASPEALSLRDDVVGSITQGIPTTPMLPQAQLSESEARALADYVLGLARRVPSAESIAGVAVPAPPPPSDALRRRGQSVYSQMDCPRCHGDQGYGDGPSAYTQTDAQGRAIRPRDLTFRPRKTGDTAADLYRVFMGGLPGTPMPSFADALAESDRWALAQYVDSLGVRPYTRGWLESIGEEAVGLEIATRAAEALEARGGIRPPPE
jgi:mono/diheme cytochrome c family protein